MDVLTHVLAKIQTAVWGPPTLFLLMGTGLFFTIALGGLQVVKFPRALKCIFEKEDGDGDVSSFATLCTTLAACIGTGSIVGVATALRIGGPGALFCSVGIRNSWYDYEIRRRASCHKNTVQRTRMVRLPADLCIISRMVSATNSNGSRNYLPFLAL